MVPTAANLDPLFTERQRQLEEFRDLIEGQDDGQAPDTTDDPATPAPDDVPTAAPTGGTAGGGAGTGVNVPLLVTVAVVVLLLGGFAAALVLRRRPRSATTLPARGEVLAAQRALLHRARSLGAGRHPNETITDTVQRWQAEHRVDESAAGDFAALAQAAAFGGDLPDNAAAEAWSAVDAMTRQLTTSVSRTDRLLAPVRVPAQQARDRTAALAQRISTLIRG